MKTNHLPPHCPCKLENALFLQRKGKKGQIFLSASEILSSFAQKQADSPVQPAVTSGCHQSTSLLCDMSSRCEKPPTTRCQNMPPTKSHPGSSSFSSNSDKKTAKCIDNVLPLANGFFFLEQRLYKVALNGRAIKKLAVFKEI